MIRMLPGTPARGGGNPARTTLAVPADPRCAALTGPLTAAVTAYRWRERVRGGRAGSVVAGVSRVARERRDVSLVRCFIEGRRHVFPPRLWKTATTEVLTHAARRC